MKKYAMAGGAILLMALMSCQRKDIKKNDAPFYAVKESAGVTVRSIGVELDPHFFSYAVGHAVNPAAENDWNLVVERAGKLNIQMLRVMVQPQWFEPVNDDGNPENIEWSTLNFNTPEMRSLYRVLDLAQQKNIDVTLVLWGCPQGHFLAAGNQTSNEQSWIVGARDEAEYAENTSILIQELVIKRNYTCVRELTPFNEPNYSYFIDGKVNTNAYISMCKKLDARLKADGIRDRVALNLADESNNYDFLRDCAAELSDQADLLNSHMYAFGYETPNYDIFNFEKKNKELLPKGLPHFIGEFGTNQQIGSYLQADIDQYLRGVLLVRMMLNVFNAGASGMSYWTLFDQYYWKDAPYDGLMKCGLWRYKKNAYKGTSFFDVITEDFQVRPHYFAYGLMTSHIQRGTEIYPIETDKGNVAATAFLNSDGRWVYVVANEQAVPLKVSISKIRKEGSFDLFQYVEGGLPRGDGMIPSSGTVVSKGGRLEIEAPPRSVVLYHQH